MNSSPNDLTVFETIYESLGEEKKMIGEGWIGKINRHFILLTSVKLSDVLSS